MALALGCDTPVKGSPTPPTEVPLPWTEVDPDLCIARSLTAGSAQLSLSWQLLEELETRSLRSELAWDRVEPSPGVFDFSGYDPVIDGELSRGIEPIGLLAYGNPWASTTTDADRFYPPDDPADFGSYAATTAAHFAGRIERYEIWNEQNAGYRFWRPEISGDPAAYGQLFAAAAEGIHAADPAATVWIGGTFFHAQVILGAEQFLDAMPQAAWEQADGLAFHPYTFYPPSVPPEYAGESQVSLGAGEIPLIEMIARLRSICAAHGRPDLPLIVTEFGWPAWGTVDRQEQADWAERSVLLGLSQGVNTWCAYTLIESDEEGSEDQFGASMADGTITPYGQRLRELSQRLRGVTEAALLDLPEGQYGVALRWIGGEERRLYWGFGNLETAAGTLLLGETPVGW